MCLNICLLDFVPLVDLQVEPGNHSALIRWVEQKGNESPLTDVSIEVCKKGASQTCQTFDGIKKKEVFIYMFVSFIQQLLAGVNKRLNIYTLTNLYARLE